MLLNLAYRVYQIEQIFNWAKPFIQPLFVIIKLLNLKKISLIFLIYLHLRYALECNYLYFFHKSMNI